MERLDFCSITSIIKEYCNEEKLGSQLNFVEKLFFSCVYGEADDTIYFDETQVCRWLKGQINVSRTIIAYYISSDEHQKNLKTDIENRIVRILYDKEMAASRLKELLLSDTTISDSQKKKLLKSYGTDTDSQIALFISELLLFAMERKFVKRETDKKLLSVGEYSPVIADYIFENDPPMPCRFFCGRDAELEKLHDELTSKSKVFLYGIAGIGKSELAKAYAKKYKKEYCNILYFSYSGDLTKDITELGFADDLPDDTVRERFNRHNRFLSSLKSDSLIIIDNYDTTTDKDRFLSDLMKYKCRILFTTRSSFYDYDRFELRELSDKEDLLTIVSDFYDYPDSEKTVIDEIIEAVHSHTFTVELAARLLHSGMLTPSELLQKLKDENVKLSSADTIGIKKDGFVLKNSYYGHIHTLFSLSELDESLTMIMRYMSFVPITGIDKRLLAKWTCQTDMNTINDLIELGYIKELPLNRICLHPMVQEITIADTMPSVSNCKIMLDNIQQNIMIMHGIDVTYAKILFETITNIMAVIDKDDAEYYLKFIEDAFVYMYGYSYESGMRMIIDEMDELLSGAPFEGNLHRALLYDFRSTIKDTFENQTDKAVKLEEKALSVLPEPSSETALLISNINANYGGLMHKCGELDTAAEYMEIGIGILREYHLEHVNQMVIQICNYATLQTDMGNTEDALSLVKKCQKLVKEYNSDICHDYAILEEVISRIYLITGRVKEATAHRKKAVAIYEKIWADQPELLEQKYAEIEQDYFETGVGLGSQILNKLSKIKK